MSKTADMDIERQEMVGSDIEYNERNNREPDIDRINEERFLARQENTKEKEDEQDDSWMDLAAESGIY